MLVYNKNTGNNKCLYDRQSFSAAQYAFYTQSSTENRIQAQGKISGLNFRIHIYINTHTHVLLHPRKAVRDDILQPLDMLGFEGNKTPGKCYFVHLLYE